VKSRPGVTVFLAAVIGLALLGFLRGTSESDYALETPLTEVDGSHAGEAPAPRSYTELRSGTTSDGSLVVTACTDCHDDRLQAARRGTRTEHPIDLPVPASADIEGLLKAGGRVAVADDGTNKVECRTCHRPHNASQDARLIVTTDQGKLCLSCHGDHGPGRSNHPVNISISGGERAAIEAIGGVADGGLSCLSCHDPHEATTGTLLRTDGTGATACRSCHGDKARQLGDQGHGGQSCVDCHGMHQASKRRGRGPAAGVTADQPCVDCHIGDKSNRKRIKLTGGHPMWQEIPEGMGTGELTGTLSCQTCHTAHSSERSLLKTGSVESTCLSCHTDKQSVTGTDHDASVVEVAGSGTVCLSCHSVHGKSTRPAPPPDVNPVIGNCLSCHDGRTTATKLSHWQHPKGLLLTAAGLPFRYKGDVPYFGPDGKRTNDRETGEIACLTCHDPHRWKHDADLHPGAADGSEQNSFLRDPDEVVRFCAVCHGTDGLPRFRFFHGEQFRKDDEADSEG